ncbi:MAG: Hg(II)-responsive transcriptional regulator [Gammaproteobacteria bacterium]|nr:MAG: Hg(II)-responsive transcriptional regulator [Gammaproteobacteria bacterium]
MTEISAKLTIGRLAEQAGVNIETIRYYQRIGLVSEPPKPQHGYRIYPADAISRIRFVKRAQDLGFALKEITDLLSLNDGDCSEARAMAEQKREMIETRIRDLLRIQGVLDTMITACRKSEAECAGCALIETLNSPD